MKEKLTLTIKKKTKEQAKRYARQKGVSVSKLVEDYLASIAAGDKDPIQSMGENPVKTDLKDASGNHDKYLYASDK